MQTYQATPVGRTGPSWR